MDYCKSMNVFNKQSKSTGKLQYSNVSNIKEDMVLCNLLKLHDTMYVLTVYFTYYTFSKSYPTVL